MSGGQGDVARLTNEFLQSMIVGTLRSGLVRHTSIMTRASLWSTHAARASTTNSAPSINVSIRGGSFLGTAIDARSATRRGLPSTAARNDVGLRPVHLVTK